MKSPSTLLLLTCYLGFISLGLPDTLLGVAWPFLRHDFALPQTAAAAAFIAMGCAYALSGSAAGRLLASLGTGRLLIFSSAAVSMAVLGFATTPAWIFFVTCTVIHGFGSGAIDTGLNDFVSRRFSASHMNWLHACFSLGAAAGPAIMTGAVQNLGAWRNGYFIVGGMLCLLTLLFFLTRSQWTESAAADTAPPVRAPLLETLAQPAVRWHLLLFFVYAGIESTVGQWSFTLLTESRHLSTGVAGGLVTTYWTAIFLGRILSGFLVPRTGSTRLVRLGIAGAALAAFLLIPAAPPVLAFFSLLLTGLALAPIFPCLMTLTPERAGAAHSANAIGLQVTAATLGIAVWPSLASLTAQLAGPGALTVLFASMAGLLWTLNEIGGAGTKRADEF